MQPSAWSVLLICERAGEHKTAMMVYIVQARTRDIASAMCIMYAVNEGYTIKEQFATEIDLSIPHKILQG